MTKTKTPFFSFGAHGSVGESITAQERHNSTLIRVKPLPTDPYSLPQAYQRWLYQDYAYLWTKQTELTKRTYAAYGSVYHLTAFQYWMKEHLRLMPDIVGWWRLDEQAGNVARDSSLDPHHGIIYGATPGGGAIANSLFFDGINDSIQVTPPPLHSFTKMTYLCFLKMKPPDALNRLPIYWGYAAAPFGIEILWSDPPQNIYCLLRNTAGVSTSIGLPIQYDTWELRGAVWDGTTNYQVRNASLLSPQAFSGTVAPTTDIFWGKREPFVTKFWYDGYIDNLIIYNRALDATEIARWSARRYPPQ